MDTLCLRKGTPRKAEAQAFVNYLLRPEVAARNMNGICYAMPNAAARALLPADLRDNPILFPPLGTGTHHQLFEDPGPFLQEMNKAWMQIKSE